MKSCTIITCNNCEFYNTQYCKNCSKEGENCYEHWEWRHDVSWRQEQIDNFTQKISDLEAKLAEKELEAIRWEEHFNNAKMDYECLKEQLAEKEKVRDWLDNVLKEYAKQEELLSQKLKSLGVDCIEDLGKTYNQDKISFAIEQLEQLKHDIWTDQQDDGWLDEQVDIYFLTEIIDNQIKQLKEMK